RDLGFDRVMAEARSRAQGGPVFVSFDIDSLDPSCAPGTGTPEAGGFFTHEALRLLRGLAGLTFAGFDLVEVAPAYDCSEITALAGATVVFEFLSLLARAKTLG
ncbi:MAG: arginase family protein, partial [Alicyclobacillus sp.]|nr:arginase family protein [Alicyclobacillus sp.]